MRERFGLYDAPLAGGVVVIEDVVELRPVQVQACRRFVVPQERASIGSVAAEGFIGHVGTEVDGSIDLIVPDEERAILDGIGASGICDVARNVRKVEHVVIKVPQRVYLEESVFKVSVAAEQCVVIGKGKPVGKSVDVGEVGRQRKIVRQRLGFLDLIEHVQIGKDAEEIVTDLTVLLFVERVVSMQAEPGCDGELACHDLIVEPEKCVVEDIADVVAGVVVHVVSVPVGEALEHPRIEILMRIGIPECEIQVAFWCEQVEVIGLRIEFCRPGEALLRDVVARIVENAEVAGCFFGHIAVGKRVDAQVWVVQWILVLIQVLYFESQDVFVACSFVDAEILVE